MNGSRIAGVTPPGKPILYPDTTAEPPDLKSPLRHGDGVETIVVRMKDNRYSVVPVTVEDAAPGIAYGNRRIGKGNQLRVDGDDFPTLARTGLHSLEELNRIEKITGRPIEEITRLGRPGKSSGEGFLADDENILSVLKGDNDLVLRLGLTHPDLARPLFGPSTPILARTAALSADRPAQRLELSSRAARRRTSTSTFQTSRS